MKTRCLLFVLLITQAAAVFAQSRSDVRLYIPMVTAEDPSHADFFRRNFSMEISGAGYTVTENIQDAAYTLRLSVRRNTDAYDDSDPQYMLQINLMRNVDSVQIVSLSFGFNELEEMYDHNLSLAYQTLANVPIGDGDGKTLVKYMVGREYEREDWWRNKWLYLRMSADYPINYNQYYLSSQRKIVAMPGATVGLEFQFFDWMSLEANFELRLWDAVGFAFTPGIGAQLKFPFKPSNHFMIEPYGAIVFSMNFAQHSVLFPLCSLGGGIQLGTRSGTTGILFFDANFLYSLGEVINSNPNSHFGKRFVIGLGVGFKTGFINRAGKSETPSTWLFNNG